MEKLFKNALETRNQAYAPYSQFKVGASILADNGQYYNGCNVENVSYPCGTCAEAGAISAMIAGGGKKIIKILIIADRAETILPCGNCLQKIAELGDIDTQILLANLSGIQEITTLENLLPRSFK